jgi:hypothetical protein
MASDKLLIEKYVALLYGKLLVLFQWSFILISYRLRGAGSGVESGVESVDSEPPRTLAGFFLYYFLGGWPGNEFF